MILNRADLDECEISLKLLKQDEHLESRYKIIENLLVVGRAFDGIFLQVQSLGLTQCSI